MSLEDEELSDEEILASISSWPWVLHPREFTGYARANTVRSGANALVADVNEVGPNPEHGVSGCGGDPVANALLVRRAPELLAEVLQLRKERVELLDAIKGMSEESVCYAMGEEKAREKELRRLTEYCYPYEDSDGSFYFTRPVDTGGIPTNFVPGRVFDWLDGTPDPDYPDCIGFPTKEAGKAALEHAIIQAARHPL